jgi:hypothetical protein
VGADVGDAHQREVEPSDVGMQRALAQSSSSVQLTYSLDCVWTSLKRERNPRVAKVFMEVFIAVFL